MSAITTTKALPTPPAPRTKRPATTPPQRADEAARAYDPAQIEAEAVAMDADLAEQEATLRKNLAEIAERRQNAIRAQQILTQQTTAEREAVARATADAERADAQAAYNADVAALNRLLAQAQAQTAALAQTVREALAADSRRYTASLGLGISTQRAGFAKRALTNHLGYKLHTAGLTDMPFGRANRTLVENGE